MAGEDLQPGRRAWLAMLTLSVLAAVGSCTCALIDYVQDQRGLAAFSGVIGLTGIASARTCWRKRELVHRWPLPERDHRSIAELNESFWRL
ncbi:MAG: hypothetical protein LLG14_24855 [Nocardiaceae bacterium]|nr:hypothetical protein [Nocardiaceae bacterium]